ncbi:MAG: lipase [Gammaproteobacteria bacterium]|nr:lipase [Gammaproteobacteria bacterium]
MSKSGLHLNYKKTIFFIAFFSSLVNTVLAHAGPITNIVFFGDSLSDIGNNTWIAMDENKTAYTIGTPITNPNEQNRKYMWVNYLVESLLQKPVYSSNQPGLSAFNDSISYAYASANTGNSYLNADWPQKNTPAPSINLRCAQPGRIKNQLGETTSTCVPGLLKQIDIYLNEVQHAPSSQSIFFIWSGANDLLNYYTAYMSHSFMKKLFIERFYLPSKEQLEKVEQQAVDNIMAAKNKLIDAGVKPERIYILDLPNLAKVPAVRNVNDWGLKTFYGKEKFVESISQMSKDFNTKLHSQLPPSPVLQMGALLDNIISKPDQYNLKNVSESCADNKADPVCSGYLFYNAKHPTTAVHKIIAENIQTAILNP